MTLETFIAHFQKTLPEASEETIQTLAQQALDEATREADRRATEASKSAVANYEKKYRLKDGVPTPGQAVRPSGYDDDPNADDTPAWARQLIEQNASLRSEIDALKRGKITDSRKATFEGLLTGLPESLRSAYLRTPYADLSDEDFAALTASVGKEVEGIVQETKTRGLVHNPRSPQPAPTDSTASKEEVEALLAASPNFGRL